LLVLYYQRSVQLGTGNQPPMAASYPGLPEELMRIGLVIVTVRARDARNAAYPADSPGARCKLPGQATGLAAAAAVAAAPGATR
jgi:hypothetical protein